MTKQPEIVVVLPWPEKVLNPNNKAHYRAKAAAVKDARELAYYTALGVEKGVILPFDELLCVKTFSPPDNRKRDLDNMGSMCKAYQDGIFDCIEGVDDSQIKGSFNLVSEKVKGGRVEIEIWRFDDYMDFLVT